MNALPVFRLFSYKQNILKGIKHFKIELVTHLVALK